MLTYSRRISLVLVILCRLLLSEVRGMTSTFKFPQFTFVKFGSLYWTVFGTHHIQTWSICKCRPVPASVSSVNNLLRGCLAPVIPNPGACVARSPQHTNTNTPQYTPPSSNLCPPPPSRRRCWTHGPSARARCLIQSLTVST